MKKKKVSLLVFLLAGFLVLIPSIVSAYTGSYNFTIAWEVTGPYNHSLANKSTSTTVRAQTFNRDGSVSSTKETYRVTLVSDRFFGTNYTTSLITANNITATRQFGTVNSGTYAVRVTRVSGDGTSNRHIQGSGTINQ